MEGIHTLKYLVRRRLGQRLLSRSERCIFYNSHSNNSQDVFQVSLPRTNVRVQLSSLWPLISQGTKTSIDLPARIVRPSAGIICLLESLGFMINNKKSVLQPTQVLEFLGIMVDTLAMELNLPRES